MFDFLSVLTDPDHQFLRTALIVGSLASLSFGVIGTYVVTRRISYLAGAIAHCIFGGIGAGLYLQRKIGLTWFDPMYGAVISALLAAFIIGWVSLYANQREDTVIGSLWAVGMAAGLLFIDRTPGYFDLNSYLFGDILLISSLDVWLVVGLNLIVLSLCFFFYNKLMAVCFDEEFAELRGIRAGTFYILLLCLTALTVVLLVRVVGIIMVIALLTIPAAVAGLFVKKLWQVMILAVFFCLSFTWSGLALSYRFELSSGPTIIVVGGVVYLVLLIAKKARGKSS